jgi:NADH dehydrogenase (ubiquinone) 1 beta subcomplex subunit 8
MLGIMSTWEYDFATTKKALIMVAAFLGSLGAVLGAVYAVYPDIPATPREFEDGLVRQLGGPGAMIVSGADAVIVRAL